jgi:hypothetical protein
MSKFERELLDLPTRQHHFHPLTFMSHHGLTMFALGVLLTCAAWWLAINWLVDTRIWLDGAVPQRRRWGLK